MGEKKGKWERVQGSHCTEDKGGQGMCLETLGRNPQTPEMELTDKINDQKKPLQNAHHSVDSLLVELC